MSRLVIKNARVVPCGGAGVLPCADVVVEGERIVSVGEATTRRSAGATKGPEGAQQRSGGQAKGHGAADSTPLPRAGEVPSERSERGGEGPSRTSNIEHRTSNIEGAEQEIDAAGRVLMPGFVDAHTHALWAGDRLAEWEMKRQGASYLEILEAGGGILSTVRAVRAAGPAELSNNLLDRLAIMLREGTTTVEVKSGYGLTTADELKMLRVISACAYQHAEHAGDAGVAGGAGVIQAQSQARAHPCTPSPLHVQQSGHPFVGPLIPTALLGHAIDPDQPGFVDKVIEETLPAVSAEFPGIAIDAYCEQGAWSVQDCRRLFERAIVLGHPIRLHADQFNSLGGVDLAIELGAMSVDHLEATDIEGLERLARSKTYGVMLPACGFHVDDRYASGRAFLDAGGKLVLASNCNPGSAPTSSMPFVIALAVRKRGLSVREAIEAATAAPAEMLGLRDRGRIAPGMRADLILLRHTDERQLAYEFGGNPVDFVICGGQIVHGTRGMLSKLV